jgi:adenylate cyclase
VNFRDAARRGDAHPAVLRFVRAAREMLPGDPHFGDPLSTAQGRPAQVVARHLTELSHTRSSASREVGLTALQLWQAVSERMGRGAGEEGAALLFTDLVGFSSWVLEVGDEAALALLREVEAAVEPAVRAHQGRIIKRLGDGHMAVFLDGQAAIEAALDIQDAIAGVEVEGHRPQLRAGVHSGRPRRLGGDYLGADVNIAARLTDAAGGGEVLVSGQALAGCDADRYTLKKRRWFRAKGTPRDIEVFAVARRAVTP